MQGGAEANLKPGSEAEVAQEQVRSEIQEYLHVSQQRRRIFPMAALVGFLAGLIGIAFRGILAGGDTLRNAMIAWAHHYPRFGWIFPVLIGAAGASIAVFMVRRFAPEASGSGIPHLEAVLHRYRELNWKRVLPVKFFGGALGIGVGMALGREGPTVQMGGTAGAAISDWLKVGTHERLILIAAGAGAGLAVAFNAPLAGLVFVLEEVQKDFRQAVFGAAFIAAATADIVARFASGQLPVFHVPSYPVPALSALPMFAVLGLVSGLLGVVYNRSLIATLNLFGRLPSRMVVAAAALVGVVIGVAGWFNALSIGGGHALAETILEGKVALSALLLWFAARFVLSMLSYGTGAPGGLFAPLLVLGALIGLGVGKLALAWFPGVVRHPEIFAVVGMAAYFTAIVRAPLTGIVLIIEMTGNYAQMLPLLVACFCAYAVAEMLNELPIYENLLERDLKRGGTLPDMKEPIVLEIEVEPGSLFAGKEVRDLGLPPGCILITCREGSREWVPTASTRLAPHMRVTAVVAPQAKDGVAILRHGCETAPSVSEPLSRATGGGPP